MPTMLKSLRLKLTLVYFLAALGVVLLVGGISYTLLRLSLYETTDQAMEVKMALIMRQYGLELPDELAQAEQNWLENRGNTSSIPDQTLTPTLTPTASPTTTPTPVPALSFESDHEDDDDEDERDESEETEHGSQESASSDSRDEKDEHESENESAEHEPFEIEYAESEDEVYDEDLAPVFVLPLNANSEIIAVANLPAAPITQNKAAAEAALINGSDLRTIQLDDGSRARLLTYRVTVPGGPATIQVGRLLRDQDRTLNQYLLSLLIISGVSIGLLGITSWWLSGRSLGPAQKAWNQQQAFVSNASHELRTPLTLIRATAEYALRQSPAPHQVDYIDEILQESDYMNRLVDDLLLLSRLDTHRLELQLEWVNLGLLMREIESQFSKLTQAKAIELRVDPVNCQIWVDPTRLRQVLLILLDNALRFTPEKGSIRLTADNSANTCQISVTDSGVGIPAKDLPHIFERFYQVTGQGIDESRNNGLGLSIAKGLIEGMGGTIQIFSQPGRGTEVKLSFSGKIRA